MIELKEFINNLLIKTGLNETIADFADNIIMLILIIIVAILGNFITRKLLVTIIHKFISKSKNTIDDLLIENKVFNRLSQLVPASIVYFFIESVFNNKDSRWIEIIQIATEIFMIVIVVLVILSFLSSVNSAYSQFSKNKKITIKSYIQVVKIVIIFVSVLVLISIIFKIDLWAIFTGLGAFAAVLLFIFNDTIKGLVGGIMLSSNDMIAVGDWISMPKYNADGDVIDISLNTVKVQNWDKTISTIPTYSMVTESFSNWRGMTESGGRRIKRSIIIDVKSVKFLKDEDIEKLKRINYISEYIEKKKKEIKNKNTELGITEDTHINGRSLTNIGTFRIYLEQYLKHNPNIDATMTFMVRQLPSEGKGLPIEIYVFSKVQEWIEYEQIQSDIFDHILAIVPEFDLEIFQNPTGGDFRQLAKK